jgi:hypothetical protein
MYIADDSNFEMLTFSTRCVKLFDALKLTIA